MNTRTSVLLLCLMPALQVSFIHKATGQIQHARTVQVMNLSDTVSALYADYGIVVIPAQSIRALSRPNPKKQKAGKHQTLFPGPLYLRNEQSTFWKKAGRAEVFIGGVEVIGMIGLVAMPKEVTKWEEDWMQSISRNWKRTFTSPPVTDQDDFWLNYIAHPVIGSWYYNSVRSQNAKWWESFLWSLAQSTFWEYVIEGMAEQPSIQDLWITPVLGTALGEPIHQATLAMRRNGYTVMEKVAVTVLNPMFVVNNGYKTPLSYQKKNLARF